MIVIGIRTVKPVAVWWGGKKGGTLPDVRKPARYPLDDEMVDHVRRLVDHEIATTFSPHGRRRSQRVIAEELHISQPTLNACFIRKTKTFGIDVLLALRAYFAERGRPMTIDQMLGLEPIATTQGPPTGELAERLATLESLVAELRATRPSHIRKKSG